MIIINKILLVILASLVLGVSACQKTPQELLKNAKGKPEELLIVMDTTLRNTRVGSVLDSIFQEKIPGLLQAEPRYKCIFIKPQVFQQGLREYSNIVTVTMLTPTTPAGEKMLTLFSDESLQKVKNDTSLFMHIGQDEYAKGQHLLHLFGQSEEVLAEKLLRNKAKIQDFFDAIVREKTAKLLLEERQTDIEQKIASQHSLSMQVPLGFKIAKSQQEDKQGFIWLRQMDKKFDRSLIIHYEPYRDKAQFIPDSILVLRDSICKKHLYEDPEKPHTYLITERLITPAFKEIKMKKRYAVQTRGMWRTNHLSMGGAFISYVWVNEKNGKLYYAEGFVYAPGSNKRDLLTELEAIIWSVAE